MTVTSTNNHVRSHRRWAIMVTVLAMATAGYLGWTFLFASIQLPSQYASIDPFLSAEFPPIADESFVPFEQETYKQLEGGRDISIDDLLRVGSLAYSQGDPARASYYFKSALSKSRDADSEVHVVRAMNNLGVSETTRGEIAEAKRNLVGAYDLAAGNRNGSDGLTERILLNLGWYLLQIGEFDGARGRYQSAEEANSNRKDEFGMGQSWSGQGKAARGLGEYTQAIAYHQQAMVLYGRLKNYRGQAREIYNMAEAELASGNIESAQGAFAEAVHIYRDQAHDWVGALQGKAGLGRVAEATGQLYVAERYATEVMEEYGDRGHRLGEALARIEVARLVERRRKFDLALDQYTIAGQSLDQYDLICRRQEISEALARLGAREQADSDDR